MDKTWEGRSSYGATDKNSVVEPLNVDHKPPTELRWGLQVEYAWSARLDLPGRDQHV